MKLTPDALLALKVGGTALVAGAVMGVVGAHAFYSPRVALERERVQSLSSALETQNKAVADLGKKTEALQKRLRTAQAEAARLRRQLDDRAAGLLALKPPQGVDQCTAASALIRQELGK